MMKNPRFAVTKAGPQMNVINGVTYITSVCVKTLVKNCDSNILDRAYTPVHSQARGAEVWEAELLFLDSRLRTFLTKLVAVDLTS